jgi:predicted naringenin-chalcone synthase
VALAGQIGNLSSASVLHIFARRAKTAAERHARRADGDGAGFCAELVLLRWH